MAGLACPCEQTHDWLVQYSVCGHVCKSTYAKHSLCLQQVRDVQVIHLHGDSYCMHLVILDATWFAYPCGRQLHGDQMAHLHDDPSCMHLVILGGTGLAYL